MTAGPASGDGTPSPALAPLSRPPADIRSLLDYERRAAEHMPSDIWRHIQAGSDAERSLAANREQFASYSLVPAMLADLRHGSTAIDLFGHSHAAPIILAPVAYHRLVHGDGEIATMLAATALDTTMVVSTLSSVSLEEVARTARSAAGELGRERPPPLWFQLYFQPDRAHTLDLVRRAEAAGYQVLVVTVDAAVKRSDFSLPPGVGAANLKGAPGSRYEADAVGGRFVFGTALARSAPTWADIEWLRTQTGLPLVIKGLLSPADARRALQAGVDGIVVSNHGGRVLDGAIAPLAALPAIRDALDDAVPLLIDGGFRYGTDVLKALALGAKAVLIGRPQLHALAVAGVSGVVHMLHILRTELELAMAQAGCPSAGLIGRDLVALRGR